MAPEQARGAMDTLDERADVFALGSILCEMLTGEPAFVGETASEVYRKVESADRVLHSKLALRLPTSRRPTPGRCRAR